jgi:tRNA-dihydrouridine synthase
MNFWQELDKPFFLLAPMDDVTDVVFRQIVAQTATPDVFMTEFVSTDGLLSPGRERVMEKLRLEENPTKPVVAQIWGSDPEKYFKVAQDLASSGFAGIDINMGCPEKGIVARGCCGGIIGNYKLAEEIISATKAGAGTLPVSVKTRIGLNSIITEEWTSFLLKQDIAALTIHGRTVREMSKVPAHWDEIAKVVVLRNAIAPQTLIIGNGDVENRAHGLDRIAESGVDGIMIGRGIFHDIFAFSDSETESTPEERLAILRAHLDLFESTWGDSHSFQILKKFFKIYISGWYGSAELRATLMSANTPEEVRKILSELPEKILV